MTKKSSTKKNDVWPPVTNKLPKKSPRNDIIFYKPSPAPVRKKIVNKHARLQMFQRFAAQNPHPTTELVYHTPFELLIAVILSAQATDVSVNKATTALFRAANNPQKMLALGEAQLKSYIKTIGLFNTKTKNILKACHMLIDRY